ncbi:microtubule-associated protein 4 isoform X6 [Falco peregrinus]|uniref:microtubule-associated protein 4 isoform X6 n=1 Tax=Falco peregrinus TaxID=8954 RepID=UPI002479A76B|nr:microtubule-associated protein 4 isoform X6 [Falco peregrinus]
MADLDHNLSLADALTEPPPEIEEEVKRDFIASLEAEKFDDVVGETVDKTDYVPLLDDDDEKAGSQEPKSKPHADGIQGEHTSATGPTVLENGDHGIEDHRTVFPGEIMDEKLSYKEFLDRNESWTMDDRDLCFESQPVFRPMEMADPFSTHRGENLPDLLFPTDMKNVPLFTDHVDASRDIHAPHGSVLVPEQPFLGPLYSPAEALDPSAFMGLDSTADFLQAEEEHWMGAQHDVKGPDASFFVEPPVSSTMTEAIKVNLPESPMAAAPGFVPTAVAAPPGEADAAGGPKGVASEKAGSILAEDTKPPGALDAGFAPPAKASPLLDVAFASAPEAKPPNAVNDASVPAADTGFSPAAGAMSHYTMDLEFAPAEDAGFAPAADVESHHAMDFSFAPAADTESPHAMDSEFAPAADTESPHAMDSEFAPAADTESPHAMDSEFAPATDTKSPHAMDSEFAPATDTKSPHAMDSEFAPATDTKSPHAMDSEFAPATDTKSPHAMDSEFAPATDTKSPHAMDSEFAPATDTKSPHAMDSEFAPATDTKSPHAMDSEFAPATDTKSPHAMDSEFAPATDTKSPHAMDSEFAPATDAEFAPAAEVNHHHAMDSGFAAVAEAKPPSTIDSRFASAEAKSVPAADTKSVASEELMTSKSSLEQDKSPFDKPLAEATANVEQESKVPEACVGLLEKAEDSRPPPSHHEEHLPEQTNHISEPAVPVEAKEAVSLENKDLLPEKSVTAVDVTVTEKQKEAAEHNHVQHAEPQQEKALQEPTGLPTAQIRQANKSSERRFGRAKPAPVPITDVPEERLIGIPQQKSTDPKVDPCSVVELRCVAGTSPRSRFSHKKATEQPSGVLSESVESCGDLPRESWDLEGSLAIVKKKKKKPKQKRNQLPRTMEFWDENVTVSKAPRNSPFAAELRKPDACPVMPAETHREQSVASGSRASGMPKDAKITTGSPILGEQNAFSVPAPGQQAPKPSAPLESVLDAKNGVVMKTEETRDGSLMLQSKGKRKEVPVEQVGKTKVGESVTAKGPIKPMEKDFLDKNEKREYKESKSADLMAPLSEAIHLSKVEAALQTKPSELLLSDKDNEAKCISPRREAFSDTVHPELQTSSGSLEAAAKEGGSCEKSKGVENEACKQPAVLEAAARLDKLPNEPEAADEAKTMSLDKCMAIDFSTSGGVLKTPTDTTKMPVTPLVVPKPKEVTALQNRKADGFSEQPFLLSDKSDATKLPTSAEAVGRMMVADSPDKNKGKGFIALEQQTGKDPNIAYGMDRPKKKRGEGKVKKIKSFSEQIMFSEDLSEPTGGVRTGEVIKEIAYPDKGRGFASRGHPSVSITHAYPADEPKKRSSDGRSKKGDKSFFQQPFLDNKMDPSSFPEIIDKTKEVSDKGRERGCITAECFRENTPDITKTQRPIELVTEEPKENTGEKEIADLGALDQPFLQESRREAAKHLAMAGPLSQTKEVDLVNKGREAGIISAGESVVVNSDATLVADKPRKRCSDGKQKSPLGPAAVLDAEVETSNLPSKDKVAGSTKDRTFGKDPVSGFEKELLLENQAGITKKVLEKPEIQCGNRSFSNQPILPGRETVEPEIVNTKETWPKSKGRELGTPEPLPEHRRDAAVAHSPTKEPVMEKPKKKSRDVKGKKAENSLEHPAALGPGNAPAVGEQVGNINQIQPFDKGKETSSGTLASLLDDLTDTTKVQAPASPPEPEKSHASSKDKCKKTEANLQQPFLLEHKAGAELFPPCNVEVTDKPEAEAPAPCREVGRLAILERPAAAAHAQAAVTDRSKKRGYDGSSKKAKNAPEQPVFPETKPKRTEVQPPRGSEMAYGMEDMDFVDENRNIKNFPTGPQMLWNNKGSHFEPFAQTAVTGPSNTGDVSPGFPKQADEAARSEGLPPSEAVAEKSSKEPGAGAKKEIQTQKSCEQPINLGHKEPGKEISKKDGKTKGTGSQDSSEAGKPLSLDHSVKWDIKSKKDEVHLSPGAKVGDKEVRTTDKKHNTDNTSSDLPQKVADSKNRPAPVDAKGTEKPEATISFGEKATGCISPELAVTPESKAEATVPRAVAEASMENKAEGAELDGGKKNEQSSLKCLGSLDNKATEAEAAGLNPTAAQTTKIGPEGDHKGHPQPAEEDAASAGEAHLKDAAALKTEVDKPQDATKEKEEECEQKAVKEAKKERVKAAEQIKGYMRPTKARGVPTLPARSAAPDTEKQRQLKPTGMSRQRQEKAKPEETKPAEAVTGNDITAPPNKELPPSPEKKTKPAASTSSAKPAATKARPLSATSPKRPASATPGPNKKPTSPTAGPTPATTAKRPATSTTRPSTLTPKETKPKVADAKTAEKRTSLSKTPSSACPKTTVRSTPTTPRTTAASPVTATTAAKNTATSPPKRPTSIKTDAKPADAKKTSAKSPSADLSRPKSATGNVVKSSATTPTTTSSAPTLPGVATSRPKTKPAATKPTTTSTATADAKKTTAKAPTKPVSKPSRPTSSVSAPDLKNVRSKIGSTDNIKHQPGGGKGKIEKKTESAAAARKSEPSAVSKMATTKTTVSKEGAPKQPNGKVQIVSKKANYSHVQSKCGSKDNIKHVPGGGNVQIQNKKVDLSKVSSKCGSKANIKHKPGGGDVKIENQKLNFKEKAQAKVGSLDNVGHLPAGGTVKIESHKLMFREKAKARTDHGAEIVVSKPLNPPSSTSPRRSTSVSESLGSVASLSPLQQPAPLAALSQQGL